MASGDYLPSCEATDTEVNNWLDLICICKQKTFSLISSINSSQTDKALPGKLPNRISPPSSCISGTACLIICETSLFVTAPNREAVLHVLTYASLASLARRSRR